MRATGNRFIIDAHSVLRIYRSWRYRLSEKFLRKTAPCLSSYAKRLWCGILFRNGLERCSVIEYMGRKVCMSSQRKNLVWTFLACQIDELRKTTETFVCTNVTKSRVFFFALKPHLSRWKRCAQSKICGPRWRSNFITLTRMDPTSHSRNYLISFCKEVMC